MNEICDFHIHTRFSSDSNSDVNKTIEKCISMGMKYMAITDHQDFGYPGDEFKLINIIDNYYEVLLSMKEKYKNDIKLSIGCEVGLEYDKPDIINDFVASKPFDFIIGSSHLVDGIDIYYPEFYENRPVHSSFVQYFDSVIKNLNTCTNFDVYGHVDYIVRYCPGKNKNFSYDEYSTYLDAILSELISMNKGIEINTGGYRAGLNEPNPCFDILKRYKELGGEIITFGSDAHTPDDIGSYFNEALSLAKAAGFNGYYIYSDRKGIKIPFE